MILETQPTTQPLDDVLADVQSRVAAVWPLKDYVALNPFSGYSERTFLETRGELRQFSDCELLMPIGFYAEQYRNGRFTGEHITQAIAETNSATTLNQVLRQIGAASEGATANTKHKPIRPRLRTAAEQVDLQTGSDWSSIIVEEISKLCSSHYDQGQAIWTMNEPSQSLWTAWRIRMRHDRSMRANGVTEFADLVATLPDDPAMAIDHLLSQCNLDDDNRHHLLLCQAFSVQGWAAYAKYTTIAAERQGETRTDLIDLIAIRLCYDVAIMQHASQNGVAVSVEMSGTLADEVDAEADADVRAVCLRASEIAVRDNLLGLIVSGEEDEQQDSSEDPITNVAAQMVFCIDVRSERIRRNLEATSTATDSSGKVDTFGFAGFFGVPMEMVSIDASSRSSQVPVLLTPQISINETVVDADEASVNETRQSVVQRKRVASVWKRFQSSAVSCFAFVETAGWLSLPALIRQSIPSLLFKPAACQHHLGPAKDALSRAGMSPESQVDLAAGILTGIGLGDELARLVVLCGHGSTTQNNPLAAGLDCGACGGHSGDNNARVAVNLLNDPSVRESLAERGMVIPDETHFLAGLHDTTTDEVTWFDTHMVPASHAADLQSLTNVVADASEKTRRERLPHVDSSDVTDLMRRGIDWSETRPEWGLAGNAAFIIAPRTRTAHVSLDGRSFLHGYDHETDPDGALLEQIMTAPLVVAHLINMQYYASTVDNRHYGSGSKTVHNVVGKFGLLSGNGGDLMTGLPMQSVHRTDGSDPSAYQHEPIRLLGVIESPRDRIDAVIAKHESLQQLSAGDWWQIVAIDGGVAHRRTASGEWVETGGFSGH